MIQRGDGVIFGIEVDRSEQAEIGPVVTFVMRLPNWVVLDAQAEHELRAYMADTINRQVQKILTSEKSDANRRALSETACGARAPQAK